MGWFNGRLVYFYIYLGACRNPASQWEANHPDFAKGPEHFPSLSSVAVSGQDPTYIAYSTSFLFKCDLGEFGKYWVVVSNVFNFHPY